MIVSPRRRRFESYFAQSGARGWRRCKASKNNSQRNEIVGDDSLTTALLDQVNDINLDERSENYKQMSHVIFRLGH